MSAHFESLWNHVAAQFPGGPWSIHGITHWRRVERNGVLLGQHHGADLDVIRLFALFHDSRRINEGHDPGHGLRGGDFARQVRGKWFDLTDAQFDLLHHACHWHTDALHHDNVTIGCCWDADRLDLGRVGAVPQQKFMSTPLAKEIAKFGAVENWLAKSK